MRILFLTQVLPFPLDAGPKTRAYYVLRHLARDHDITIVSFTRSTDTPESIAHLSKICINVYTVPMPRSKWRDGAHFLRSTVTGEPFIITRDRVQLMKKLLTEITQQVGPFDAIHADQLWMAPYALQARDLFKNCERPTMILDQHNAVFMIPQRLADGESNPVKRSLLRLESRKMAQYEVEVCSRFDQVVWVTQDDYDAVQSQAESGHKQETPCSAVIPICTDPEAEPVVCRKQDPRRITFLGGLHYPPNAQGILWFAERVFPSIVEQVPDAVLTVIGKQPPEGLRHLGIEPRNLDVTGYVADVKPYLEDTAVFVVPLHAGGGMRVKILDAWTWGLPIVSTTVGAEGISICPDEDILIADDPQLFAASVVRLFQDAELSDRIARQARQSALEKYNWRTRYEAWDAVYCSSNDN